LRNRPVHSCVDRHLRRARAPCAARRTTVRHRIQRGADFLQHVEPIARDGDGARGRDQRLPQHLAAEHGPGADILVGAAKQVAVEERAIDDLPPGDTLIRVQYSSLNYKDALSATGHRGITRRYPHTPGIDAAGVVVSSSTPRFAAGERAIVTGYDLGMNSDGGYGGRIRVPAGWVVPLPPALDTRTAMALGTAGLTAALCVDSLLQVGIAPEQGEVLVTGATGGVGSIAVMLLAQQGFRVVAGSGKTDRVDWLKSLGAAEVIGRDALLHDLTREADAARDGSPRRLLLVGPAGVGKTRVLDELEARLRLRGARVVRVSVQPAMQDVRFAALVA